MTNKAKPLRSLFTDGQWQAITQEGQNLLVSASAGSGKTTVLVQRVIEKLKEGQDIDHLLIVTFTEKAAFEMKERIEEALKTFINEESNPEQRRHYLNQLSNLPLSYISTIDAFCLRILRQFYYLIDVDPGVRLLTDQTQQLLLKDQALTVLKDRYLEAGDEDFSLLLDALSGDRSFKAFDELILEVYEFSQVNAQPQAWLDSLDQLYDMSDGFSKSVLYQNYVKPVLFEEFNDLSLQIENLENESRSNFDTSKDSPYLKIIALLEGEREHYQHVMQALANDYFDQAVNLAQTYTFKRFPSIREEDELLATAKDSIKDRRNAIQKAYKELVARFLSYDEALVEKILKGAGQQIALIGGLSQEFSEIYGELKQEDNYYEFADIEHLAYQILMTEDQNGVKVAQIYYQELFNEVMVDEYQDVNPLQEAIIQAVTRLSPQDEGNLFIVGDVKQSIYGFRLAEPQLFINKFDAYGKGEGGQRIILAENFRSRDNIIDFTNYVFQQIMDRELGQIDYDDDSELVLGNLSYPEDANQQTELLIYESESVTEAGEEDFGQAPLDSGQVKMLALKIKEMVDSGFEIWDGKTKSKRSVRYGDFAVIASTRNRFDEVDQIFGQFEIPVDINGQDNYFKRTETLTMLSILQTIDNPVNDYPLVAVLRSAIFKLTEPELAEIRLSLKNGPYFYAVLAYLENESQSSTYTKLKRFYELLIKWRNMVSQNSIAELIWQIYLDTNYIDYVGGLSNGEQRQNNLHAFYQIAVGFEDQGLSGLFHFVSYIKKMRENQQDLGAPVDLNPDRDSVIVTTIHQSKGLEFNIVFLMDTNKRFNLTDLRQNYILSENLGLGINYADPKENLVYDNMVKSLIQEDKKRSLYSEELRKLYVALTRAQQKLIIVGETKDFEKLIAKWINTVNYSGKVLHVQDRLKTDNYLDWIGYSLVRHPDFKDKINFMDVAASPITSHRSPFDLAVYSDQDLLDWQKEVEALAVKDNQIIKAELPDLEQYLKGLSTNAGQEVVADLALNDLWKHSYSDTLATQTASYQSVTELKRLDEDPDLAELRPYEENAVTRRHINEGLAQPSFLVQDQVDSKAVGTAVHLLLQKMTYSDINSPSDLEVLLRKMVENGYISEKQANQVPLSAIMDLVESEFGQELRRHEASLHKEVPFSLMVPAGRLFPGDYDARDQVLMHGMIDGYYDDGEGLVLYDYKTDQLDHYGDRLEAEVHRRYDSQLRQYQTALEVIENRPIKKAVVVLVNHGRLIDFYQNK